MEEKKEIKMSLWTFCVLVAGIVALIGAVIIGGFYVLYNASRPASGIISNNDKIIQDTMGSSSNNVKQGNKGNTIIVDSTEEGQLMVTKKDSITGEMVTNVVDMKGIESETNVINSSTMILNTVLPIQVEQ